MMITYGDIRKSVNSLLKMEFNNIDITSRDVSEGFKRPSFFVPFENTVRSGELTQVHKELTVQIYYFPTDRYNYATELESVQERLENLFDLKLGVLDRFFNVDETNGTVTDGVLSFSFEIAFYDGREIQDAPLMQELDVDMKKG